MIITGISFGSMVQVPMSIGYYSAPSSAIHTGKQVYVSGIVLSVYSDAEGASVPIPDIQVRLFGTDDLKVETVTTDAMGLFYSTITFEAGQRIKVTIEGEGQNFFEFIDYEPVGDTFFLGTFFI